MRNVMVDFKIEADSSTKYWIAVSNEDVSLENGKGRVVLMENEKYILTWWMTGNPKAKISIVGTAGDRKVVEVKESRIPDGHVQHAAVKRFSV